MVALCPYEPVNTLKGVAENLWIVDGPVIHMRYFSLPLSIPFSTRMTLVRLPGGGLWVHSPTALTPSLQDEVKALGLVQSIVGPNDIHYWWLKDWAEAFPDAGVFIAPGIARRAGARLPPRCTALEDEPPKAWEGVFDMAVFSGRFMTEFDFFHTPSGTAILTDLIENFERGKVRAPLFWWACKFTGCAAPHGKMPLDLRSTFRKSEVTQAAHKIVSWPAERVIFAHGKWYRHDGQARLEQALSWAL